MVLLHFGQGILALHAARDAAGVVERVAYRGSDGKAGKRREIREAAEEFSSVLLTAGTGAQGDLRIARARLRQCEFPGLFECRRRRREIAVVSDCLLHESVDGIGPEESPPIALDFFAKD